MSLLWFVVISMAILAFNVLQRHLWLRSQVMEPYFDEVDRDHPCATRDSGVKSLVIGDKYSMVAKDVIGLGLNTNVRVRLAKRLEKGQMLDVVLLGKHDEKIWLEANAISGQLTERQFWCGDNVHYVLLRYRTTSLWRRFKRPICEVEVELLRE